MTWEDFLQHKLTYTNLVAREKTEIECPRCGKFVWKRLDKVLMSNPPQYQYECDCGWVGYHTI